MTTRMNRQIFGMLAKRLDEAGLDEPSDHRDPRGKRWRLGALLRAVVGGMLAGSKSLADVEQLRAWEALPGSKRAQRVRGAEGRSPDLD